MIEITEGHLGTNELIMFFILTVMVLKRAYLLNS